MRAAARLRRARALLWFIATLLVLLAVGAVILLARQRGLLREEIRSHIERETGLLASVISEDLQKRNYAAIGKYVSVYGREHDEIASIRVIAPNNYVLAA